MKLSLFIFRICTTLCTSHRPQLRCIITDINTFSSVKRFFLFFVFILGWWISSSLSGIMTAKWISRADDGAEIFIEILYFWHICKSYCTNKKAAVKNTRNMFYKKEQCSLFLFCFFNAILAWFWVGVGYSSQTICVTHEIVSEIFNTEPTYIYDFLPCISWRCPWISNTQPLKESSYKTAIQKKNWYIVIVDI